MLLDRIATQERQDERGRAARPVKFEKTMKMTGVWSPRPDSRGKTQEHKRDGEKLQKHIEWDVEKDEIDILRERRKLGEDGGK